MQIGILYAALAFLIWGLFPLYFHALQDVPATQILAHRVLWSLVFLGLVLGLRRQWKWLPAILRQPRLVLGCMASAALLATNWFIYIWAINNGHVIDASLGYFINPLVNVMLGYLLLKERLRPLQWLAIALAGIGVAWLTILAGSIPWIALVLAISFGVYGLMRKTASLGSLEGLSMEALMLFPLALAYVVWLSMTGENAFLSSTSDATRWLLVAAGPITAIPLLLFAAGARRIPLSVLGLMQYIGPTIVFFLGIWMFHETFSYARLAGFILIWSALALYAAEGLLKRS